MCGAPSVSRAPGNRKFITVILIFLSAGKKVFRVQQTLADIRRDGHVYSSPLASNAPNGSSLAAIFGRTIMVRFARVPHWIAVTLDVLKALLTPVIAAIAVYIAYQQYQVNKRKFEFDRYERRIHIYREVRAVLIRVQRDFKPEIAELQNFITATAEADFLFGPEIPAYIDEIVKRGWALRSAHNQYRDMFQPVPPGYDHEKVVSEMHEQETWFTEQIPTGAAKAKFKKYLDVSR
jgi:hypothetical protein